MKYLLSAEEYESLRNVGRKLTIEAQHTLQKMCTEVANLKPVIFWGNKEAKIWGCILNEDGNGYDYCDECPAQNECPYPSKRWSK